MDFTRLANFLFEVGSLRKIPRMHRQTLGVEDMTDNIASHSFRVAIIGYLLAKAEGADVGKVLQMCLFHDIPEARSGDQNWVHKKYVKVFEDEIVKDQFAGLLDSDEALDLVNEYSQRESKEAIVAKDADLIDQMFLIREHMHIGSKEAEDWMRGNEQAKRVKTESAKKLLQAMEKVEVHDWWVNLWTSDRRV